MTWFYLFDITIFSFCCFLKVYSMWRKIDSFVDFLTLKSKPFAQFINSFYKRFLAFYCSFCANWFVKKIARFLNSSAVYRKKVLDSNLFYKFRLLSLVAIAVLGIGFVWKSSLSAAWVVALTLVLMWFVFRGYRAAYVVACAIFALLTLVDVFYDGWSALLFLCGLIVASIIWFLALNAEMVRVNLEKSFQLRKKAYSLHKDMVVACLLLLLVLLGGLVKYGFSHPAEGNNVSEIPTVSQNQKLSLAAGTAARHLYGYQDYCHKQGYNLVIYPEVFRSKFATHLAKIEKDLSQYGETTQTFYNQAKSRLGRKLEDSIAVDIENIRRQAIIELVAVNQNTESQNVRWNNDMSKLISTAEACALFDEMAETILLKPNASFQQIMSY